MPKCLIFVVVLTCKSFFR